MARSRGVGAAGAGAGHGYTSWSLLSCRQWPSVLPFTRPLRTFGRPSGGWLGLVELPNARLLLDLRLLVSARLLGVGVMLVGLGLGWAGSGLEAPGNLLGGIVVLRGQRRGGIDAEAACTTRSMSAPFGT